MATTQEAHGLGQFPVWGYLGGSDSLGYYGLPEFGQPGIKVAKHIVRGRDDDPDRPDPPSEEEIEDLRAFIAECFAPPLTEILDLDNVSKTREYGSLGLCQLWKQLRDHPQEFPIYDNGINSGPIYKNLGQLKYHRRLAADRE